MFRDNETLKAFFQRSGKQGGGLCVSDGGNSVVGAALGFCVSGIEHGLLRRGDVPAARACA